MINSVRRFIQQHRLMESNGKYLVALSGGADSVALLLVLQELGYHVEAVHCNFHLRGEESDRDENFCVNLCKKLNIELHRVHFDTRTFAELHQVSIEMAARELRYNHFKQLIKDGGFQGVCVAHHRDDSVETILLNLVRGTGIHGLTGIAPKNGNIIRPLLCVSRDEIEQFLRQRNQDFVTDSTNLVNDVKRNKMRLDIIPQLKEMNPSFNESLMKMANHLNEAEKILDDAAKPLASSLEKNGFIEYQSILESPSSEYLMFQIFSPFGFSHAQIAEMTASQEPQTGTVWRSETHELLFDRGRWLLQPITTTPQKSLKIPEEGTYIFDDNTKIRLQRKQVDDGFSIPKEKNCISLDYKKIHFPLILRTCQTGDRFIPFGMKGSKLVSDYLTDVKKNLFERRHQLVLQNGNGDILWLVGERTDNRYRITDETTNVLEFRVERH